MKTIRNGLLLFILVLHQFNIFAQQPTLAWATKVGGGSSFMAATGVAITADGYGNSYTVGNFIGTVDFDPGVGVFNLTAAGQNDVFVYKQNAQGALVWARAMGGANYDSGLSISVDNAGNVYTTGVFQGTADFDPGLGVFNLTTPNPLNDVFISKLDQNGNFVWALSVGGYGKEELSKIKIDVMGNILVTGVFRNTVDFDPGVGVYNIASNGLSDVFVLKLFADGSFDWAVSYGGADIDFNPSISVDQYSNVYATGSFIGTVDVDPGVGVFNITSNGGEDVFYTKLDPSGNLIWANQLGGVFYDIPLDMEVSSIGEIYLTGYFRGSVDFDPSAHDFILTSPQYNPNVFICRLSTNAEFVWAVSGSAYQTFDMSLDAAGNVYSIGVFDNNFSGSGNPDFDPSNNIATLYTFGSYDIFIQRLDFNGNFNYVLQLGGSTRDDGIGIHIDSKGNIFSTGIFTGTCDFDPEANTFTLSGIGINAFTAKYAPPCPTAWVHPMGSLKEESGNAIVTDGSGFIYSCGYFNETVDFNAGIGQDLLTSTGNRDVYVTKTDACGQLIWAKKMGGTSADEGNSLTVDSLGNVYITGSFSGTADFDPGAGYYPLTATGYEDVFVCKLNSGGEFVWARKMGGTLSDVGYGITLDQANHVYLTGYFAGTADFSWGFGLNLVSAGSTDIFVTKLTEDGTLVWAKRMGGADTDMGKDIIIDAGGQILTTGFLGTTGDFDPGVGVYQLTSVSGIADVFISKLNNLGNFVWAKNFGNAYGSGCSGNGIATDLSGNIYITGSYAGLVDFDPSSGVFNMTANGRASDIFVTKYTSQGNFLWAKSMGGNYFDAARDIAVSGNAIYTTGFFSHKADFDPAIDAQAFIESGKFEGTDIFVSKLDLNGNYLASGGIVSVVAKETDFNRGNGITIDADGNVMLTGQFYAITDFNPDLAITNSLTSAGDADAFICKLNSQINFTRVKNMVSGKTATGVSDKGVSYNQTLLNAYPNPFTKGALTLQFNKEVIEPVVMISDLTGRVVYHNKFEGKISSINLNELMLNDGAYFITVKAEHYYAVTRLIKNQH